MKLKRTCLFLSFAFMFALFTNAIEVNAMNTGFSTEEVSEKTRNRFVSNIELSLLTTEPVKKGIQCFDVNEKGMVAIGQNGADDKRVCIYDSDGKFLYGYTFDVSQSFGVEWDGEYINIYFVRSDVIISLDSDCNVLDIKKIQNTMDNNTYSDKLKHLTRSIGDTTYLVRNDMGIFNLIALSYSQVVTIDSTGAERIIYDINSEQLFITISLLIIILGGVSGAIVVLARQCSKLMQSN